MAEKVHVAAWYPFGEQFVIWWKDHPFFIVPYGSGQINKFCVVGLDKTGKQLKCKNTKHPNHPQHQVHLQLVQKEMTKLNLTIHNKTICEKRVVTVEEGQEDRIQAGREEEEEEKEDESIKALSVTPISVTGTDLLHVNRRQHYLDSPALPAEFKPTRVPDTCKCDIVGEDGRTSKGRYKPGPDLYQKPTTLWFPYGPPETRKRCYLWKCAQNNPACTVHYDGHEDGILNYSNSTMVSHVILFEFLFGFITGYVTKNPNIRFFLLLSLFSPLALFLPILF